MKQISYSIISEQFKCDHYDEIQELTTKLQEKFHNDVAEFLSDNKDDEDKALKIAMVAGITAGVSVLENMRMVLERLMSPMAYDWLELQARHGARRQLQNQNQNLAILEMFNDIKNFTPETV